MQFLKAWSPQTGQDFLSKIDHSSSVRFNFFSVEELEMKLQQERVTGEGLQGRLAAEQRRVNELTLQLSREKSESADLQVELSDLQNELTKVQAMLEREKTRAQGEL